MYKRKVSISFISNSLDYSNPRLLVLWFLTLVVMVVSGCGGKTENDAIVLESQLTLTVSPVATLTPTPVLSPTPTPTREPPEAALIHYTIQSGDTLSGIATYYGTSIDSLATFNGVLNADQLIVGQVITIPVNYYRKGPEQQLVPDSELVYGPAFVDFDVAAATSGYTGFFSTHTEPVNGQLMTAAEIVQLIATQYSVGPRVLLALLELRGGWLTNPEPPEVAQQAPLGYMRFDHHDGLYFQLAAVANALNGGFYGWLWDDLWLVQLDDGEFVQYAATLNAGTAAIQRALAIGAADYDTWQSELSPGGFPAVYRRLFGDPYNYELETLIPPDIQTPEMVLPWSVGEVWYFTGAPHPGWGSDESWSALDFATGERNLACRTSRYWVTAVAPGQIILSEAGMVWEDLDGDGLLQTGWNVLYMHMAEQGRVAAGTVVAAGDRIGHPSCEGGVANASHLHIARRYNGVWIPAASPSWPFIMSGWLPVDGPQAYDGLMVREGEEKQACECWDAINGILRMEP